MLKKPIEWPNGARCAVLVTFDLDGESISGSDRIPDGTDLCYRNYSYVSYGPSVAMPRFLDILDHLDIPSTVFTPGRIAEFYPQIIKDIDAGGHEIGLHGYDHENFNKFDKEGKRMLMRKARDIFLPLTGKPLYTYRTPGGDMDNEMIEVLHEEGYTGSCCMWNNDVPMRIMLNGEYIDMVEMPGKWALNDHPYYYYNYATYGAGFGYKQSHIANYEEAFNNIRLEFEGCYKYGTCCTLTIHPNVSGRPGRIAYLESLWKHMKSKGDVWFTTAKEMTDWYLKNYEERSVANHEKHLA